MHGVVPQLDFEVRDRKVRVGARLLFATRGRDIAAMTLEEMDAIWDEAKKA